MSRRTILLGLAPVLAVAACLRTDGGAPAGGGPARGTAVGERREAAEPQPAAAQQQPKPAAAEPEPAAQAKAAGTPLERKLAAIRKINEYADVLMQIGGRGPGMDFHYAWSKRQMEAEREAAKTAKERTAAAEGHLKRMQLLEKRKVSLKYAPTGVEGRLTDLDVSAAQFYVAEAEQWLADAQAAEKQPG